MSEQENTPPESNDFQYQEHILQGVSRTFALTIPQLPGELNVVVSNAYLLCRIADTIEDDRDMPFSSKKEFSERFIAVVSNREDSRQFAEELSPLLSDSASADEKDLIQNTESVLRITHSFNDRQRQALERCIRLMADGMSRYQESDVRNGLEDQQDMDSYCYYVAGVVGEMLTELFCDYSADINRHYDEMMKLAVSFGQGLQMTNILKDIWEDQQREMCWLPSDLFEQYGLDLADLAAAKNTPGFQKALSQLVGIARSHLANALRYTLLIPPEEVGIRRFCLWALGMALLTLRKIHDNPEFNAGRQVKISRNSVKATIFFSNLLTRHDTLLNMMFRLTAASLPETELDSRFALTSETG